MKTIHLIVIILLLGLGMSCSKNDPEPADSLIGRQWYGFFAYPGETISRVFAIKFSAGSDFIWQDLSGDYTGKWKRTNDEVTITFNENGIQTTFKLLDNNQLTSPKNLNHSAWTIRVLNKIENAVLVKDGPKLPKTYWAGSLVLSFDNYRPGWLFYEPGTEFHTGRAESYSVSGPVLRIDKSFWDASVDVQFFGVFINETTLFGNFQNRLFNTKNYTALTSGQFIKKP